MLLSSSLEPNGPKSTHHYIILNYDDRRALVKLPETYADLTKVVEGAYHIDRSRFWIATKEMNICAGERIRVPEEAWDDLSKLLGNVHVVPCNKEVLESEKALEVEGVLKTEELSKSEKPLPLKSEKALGSEEVLKSKEPSTSEKPLPVKSEVPSKSEVPVEMEVPVRTEEPLEIETSDSHPESLPGLDTVNLPTQVQTVPDPIAIDKNALYQQILACGPGVSEALAAVREEIKLSNHSTSGIKWRSRRIHERLSDVDLGGWDARPYTLLVLRYNLKEATDYEAFRFQEKGTPRQFDIDVYKTKVCFCEGYYRYPEDGEDGVEEFQNFKPSHSILTKVGDHSIALINHGGKIYVFFDFKESTILPETNFVITQKMDELSTARGRSTDVDVYDFN